MSKVLVDKGVLGGHRKEAFLFVFVVGRLIGGNVDKEFKVIGWGWGVGSTGDNVLGTVRDVEEGVLFRVVKGRPDKSRGWGVLEFKGTEGQ